ncbi:MAG: AAA family ATPase [Bacteroidaceae bacterium]|nr:AAA family ATPase [Bacteroidaceae bacterium]
MDIKERFQTLLSRLNEGVYEKDTEIGLSLLAALAGESVLLLGPPGVAKSMVARRIKAAFSGAKSFEYLMSRFSTPDEIFGPVSISRLKTSDVYERNLDGFMPTADIAFLDEIWKAGPSILNTLLTIINEKTYRNGNDELHVPLKLLIGASNELPADGEGLEALWDRFLVRIVSGCVKNEENFYHLLRDESEENAAPDIDDSLLITAEEYADWTQRISRIGIDDDVLKSITYIRQHIQRLTLTDDTAEGASRVHHIYISDRRWKHIVRLLRASAFIHGRASVAVSDMIPLVYCLWNEPEEIPFIRPVVVRSFFVAYADKIERLASALAVEVKRARARRALAEARAEDYHRDDNKELFDSFYYRIDKYGTGNTYIFFVDYKKMKGYSRENAPLEGVICQDTHNTKRNIVLMQSDSLAMQNANVQMVRVKLYRDNDNIYINGVQYPIHQLARGQRQAPIDTNVATLANVDYEQLVENLAGGVRDVSQELVFNNLFVTQDDKQEIDRQTKEINRKIALLRYDLQQLLYGE